MTLRWPDHEPTDKRPYGVDWSALLDTGETISASTWDVPDGVTNADNEQGITGSKTYIWVTGGTAGRRYLFKNVITTSLGKQHTVRCTLPIKA